MLDLSVIEAVLIERTGCDAGNADNAGRGLKTDVGKGYDLDILLKDALDGSLDISGENSVDSEGALPYGGVLEVLVEEGDAGKVLTCSNCAESVSDFPVFFDRISEGFCGLRDQSFYPCRY